MTKEEKLKIFEEAEDRCYEALRAAEPGECMEHILKNLSSLQWRAEFVRNPPDDDFPAVPEPEPDADKDEVAPAKEPVKLDPIEEPPTTEAPGEEEPKPPTKEQVRAKLATYQVQANLDVATLLQGMGYSKLSEVPASRYWELLEQAQKTVDGEG